MGDILSQSEIDALLAAMASGDPIEEEKKDSSLDESKVPSAVLETVLKFTNEDIQNLEQIHKQFLRFLSPIIPNLNVEIALQSIQEVRYEELIHSLPSPALMVTFKFNSLDGHFLLESSPSLLFDMMKPSLRGNRDQSAELIELSELDKQEALQMLKNFIKPLETAWNKALPVKAEIDSLEIEPAKIKLFENGESIVLLSFSATLGKKSTLFNLCIPYSSIEKHLGNLAIKPEVTILPSAKDIDFKFEIKEGLGDTTLNIKVVLDTLQLPLNEIMNLKKGMVLNTHKIYKNKVSILIEEKHCYNGEAGLISNRKAVKIIDCLEGDV